MTSNCEQHFLRGRVTLENKTESSPNNNNVRSSNRFIFFSVVFFLVIIILGSLAFVFSMREIIRRNNANELTQMLEIERIKLETSVNAEISLVLKLADSPLVKRYLANPEDEYLERTAIDEIASYRRAFAGNSIFWVNDIDKMFYSDDNESYWVDTESPDNYWYPMPLYKTEVYNFNINYNHDLNVTNLWINAPVFNNDGKPIGMVGTSFEISSFINMIYQNDDRRERFYLFNAQGEVTGADDIELVTEKEKIYDVLHDIGIGDTVFSAALELEPMEAQPIAISGGTVIVGTVPALEWYSVVILDDSLEDYRNGMTVFFIVVLLVISGIFIIFNIFIADFLKSLNRTMESLEEASNAKTLFLANMSHEIRTPMNAIIGMSELLSSEELNFRQRGYVNDISNSANSLLDIINSILDMSKIETGKLDLVPVDYDFNVFVDNIVSLFRFMAQKKDIELIYETEGDLPKYLYGDDVKLRQVITNLCSNAVKFTDRGYVKLRTSVVENSLVFEVIDTGRGIDKEAFPTLFNAFAQFGAERNRHIVGTGLGLSIAKTFVDMMNGEIKVDSVVGEGSTFTVTVPIILGDPDKVYYETTDKHDQSLNASAANVLVVDDNEFNLRVADGLLSLSQIKAVLAFSGREAIDLVKENDYDIIFMDHMMPEMDGVEATAEIRALGGKYEQIPIIALTANAIQGAREMFLENGFNDFVSKPIYVQDLNDSLIKWLPKDKVVFGTQQSDAEPDEHESEAAASADDERDFWDMLGEIDEINIKIGLNRVSGMESMYRDSLELLSKALKGECDSMSASLESGNMNSFSISVHAMKSMLSTVGAMELSEIALKLEMSSKSGDIHYCTEHYPPFQVQLLTLNDQLATIFDTGESLSEKDKGSEEFLRDSLQRALEAANEYDSDLGVEIMQGVLAFDFGDEINSMLESIMTAFSEFDCENAMELLSSISV